MQKIVRTYPHRSNIALQEYLDEGYIVKSSATMNDALGKTVYIEYILEKTIETKIEKRECYR